ncbi:hypothetical protein ACS0TY_022945 [Phlomoides rotata]
MKKVMKPAKGFNAREVGSNLFSFQFRPKADMREVIAQKPWHFDKNLLVLKEVERGEQPSKTNLNTTLFWVRLYY